MEQPATWIDWALIAEAAEAGAQQTHTKTVNYDA